eukprot:3396548-Pleurochrysis_carterae.AAC.1
MGQQSVRANSKKCARCKTPKGGACSASMLVYTPQIGAALQGRSATDKLPKRLWPQKGMHAEFAAASRM